MRVFLDYFNPDSGAWCGNGFYNTEMTALHQVVAEVKFLMQRKELPNVVDHAVYTVAISFQGRFWLVYGHSVA
jgi:hypothetical protein